MYSKILSIILSILLIVFYIYGQNQFYNVTDIDHDDKPVISFDLNDTQISVNKNEEALLNGVTAYDEQDGDVTNNIIIESLSIFLDDTTRRVNYVVFDNDGNISTASRLIKYTDYTAPVFSMTNQLRSLNYSTASVTSILHATSCVDGDISNNITIMDVSFITNEQLRLKISVTDSTNTTSYLNLNYYLEEPRDIEIVLEDYLIYLDCNETYDFKENIINVVEKIHQDITLIDSIEINVPEMNEPGTYEVTYSIQRPNGNSGITTCIVVVE